MDQGHDKKRYESGFSCYDTFNLGNIKRRHRRHLKLTSKLKLRYMVIPGPSGCVEFQPLDLKQRISDPHLDFRP